MSTNQALELLLGQPTTPVAFAGLVLFALVMCARVYTFTVAMRGAKPAERPAIMREHSRMWAVRNQK
ncbi:hypothetical protein [Streptomyces sp. NPDC058155]|uniref:hypothetical protein n=1 Tax=Streptomyces sp. NPDC058155 TaxID=3346359 RepID=UPI0036E6B3D2